MQLCLNRANHQHCHASKPWPVFEILHCSNFTSASILWAMSHYLFSQPRPCPVSRGLDRHCSQLSVPDPVTIHHWAAETDASPGDRPRKAEASMTRSGSCSTPVVLLSLQPEVYSERDSEPGLHSLLPRPTHRLPWSECLHMFTCILCSIRPYWVSAHLYCTLRLVFSSQNSWDYHKVWRARIGALVLTTDGLLCLGGRSPGGIR